MCFPRRQLLKISDPTVAVFCRYCMFRHPAFIEWMVMWLVFLNFCEKKGFLSAVEKWGLRGKEKRHHPRMDINQSVTTVVKFTLSYAITLHSVFFTFPHLVFHRGDQYKKTGEQSLKWDIHKVFPTVEFTVCWRENILERVFIPPI